VKAEILEAGRPVTAEPLTCTRDLGDCPVGNRRLIDVQHERLARCGLTAAAHLGEGLFWRGQAWLSDALLSSVADRTAPWVIRDAQGEALAWLGPRAGAVDTAVVMAADEASFLIRYPWDLLRVNELLLAGIAESRIEGVVSPAAQVEGTLILGPGSRLLPGVYVEGTVVVGAGCKIGPNCYLRGSTSIGDACHIGQSVEIKNSILMQGAAIGHLSYCGDSIIGEKVNFGAGTITANFRHDGKPHRSMVGGVLVDTGRRKFGTILGDHVHTGIHTSIYPGRKLWPGVMTRPGTVVRQDLVAGSSDTVASP
jgi:acetyltransferase-like isoleucine patch superfamily enzyme